MAGERDRPEQTLLSLRQVEVLQGHQTAIADAVRQIGVTKPTYCRWRRQYGGTNPDQLKRLKELKTENQRLRRAVSDLILDSEARAATGSRSCRTILSEAGRRNF